MKISHYFIFVFSLALIFSFVSCTDDQYSLGSDLVQLDAHLKFIDTCTVVTSTVMADSIQTSAKGVALVGRYRDKYLGLTSAYSYITFGATTQKTLSETAVFDSITLTLRTNSAYYGDTTQPFDFTIHALTKNVVLNNDGVQYNIHSVPYAQTPLATVHFRRKPITNKTYEIKLANSLGQDFFNKLKVEDPIMDEDNFNAYFHGFAFVPSSSENASIAGFNVSDTSSVFMHVYYHHTDDIKDTSSFVFSVGSDSEKSGTPLLQFNHYEYDWTNNLFKLLLENNKEISSDKTNNLLYVSNIHGLMVKIRYPYLSQLNYLSKYVEINSAKLILKPINGSYKDETPLPTSLNLYKIDVTNTSQGTVNESSSSTTAQTGSLKTDYVFGINTNYSFDISTYLSSEIYAFGVYAKHLELIIPTSSSLQTLVLGDSKHAVSPMKTNLYYLMYDSSSK